MRALPSIRIRRKQKIRTKRETKRKMSMRKLKNTEEALRRKVATTSFVTAVATRITCRITVL